MLFVSLYGEMYSDFSSHLENFINEKRKLYNSGHGI